MYFAGLAILGHLADAHKINDVNQFDLTKSNQLTDNWRYSYSCNLMIYPAKEIKSWAVTVTWRNTPLGPSWTAEKEFPHSDAGYYEYVVVLGQDSKGMIDLKGLYILTEKLNFKSGARCSKMYP